MSSLSASKSRRTDVSLLVLRLFIGGFLIYHGIEVFDDEKMKGYAEWIPRMATFPSSSVAYAGKVAELLAGLCITAGLVTRVASVLVILVFLLITFNVGQGRIYMEEQHPFMFVLFGFLFLMEGAGRWSIDYFIKNLRHDRRP